MLHFRRMLAPQLARAAIAIPARATSLHQTASLSSVSGDASPPTAFSPLNTSFQTIPPFSIIDTTLREGEQFATTEFTQHDRVYIAKLLDQLGVEYIELVNPIASKQAAEDCATLPKLGLKAKIVAHTRCHMADVTAAVETGIDGVSIYMATSEALRKHSHGKGVQAVIEDAKKVIQFVLDHGMEVRFSCEDTFRSNRQELLDIYAAVDELGVHRVGLADTVGVAHPVQVAETVAAVRSVIKPTTGIEFHTHDDTGCCIANALVALQHGATHINTCVLGIGERNGITPLGGFLARMYVLDKENIRSKYDLKLLRHLEKYVARAARISVPFNNYVTGTSAFTHKAGVHSKAVMADPSAYEVIDPQDFGVDRRIEIAHRLTGWNALAARARELRLEISDDQIKVATKILKQQADDTFGLTGDQLDEMLLALGRDSAPIGSSKLFAQAKAASSSEQAAALEAAARAMEEVELKTAQGAMKYITGKAVDHRPTRYIRVSGHLFDKAVLNRLLDLVVDSPCAFEVKQLRVPPRDEEFSVAVLQLWGDSEEVLDQVKADMDSLVDANSAIAHCTLEQILSLEEDISVL